MASRQKSNLELRILWLLVDLAKKPCGALFIYDALCFLGIGPEEESTLDGITKVEKALQRLKRRDAIVCDRIKSVTYYMPARVESTDEARSDTKIQGQD